MLRVYALLNRRIPFALLLLMLLLDFTPVIINLVCALPLRPPHLFTEVYAVSIYPSPTRDNRNTIHCMCSISTAL